MKQLLTFSLLALFFLTGCSENNTPSAPTYKGAEQTLGNGKASSWVKFSADNIPTSIGFTLTKGALDNLPHGGVALVLSLPAEAVGKTPFDHIMLDYLHTGHEPPGVYDVYVSAGLRDGTPTIALPLDNDDGQRRYRLGSIIVK